MFVGYDVGFARRFTFIPFQSICIICASFVSELGHECSGILRFSDTNFLEYGWTARHSVLGRGKCGVSSGRFWILDLKSALVICVAGSIEPSAMILIKGS